MKKKRRKRSSLSPPALGRNFARRSGGGVHKPEQDKRAEEKLRREIEEGREDSTG
jgi:hypothetical protein